MRWCLEIRIPWLLTTNSNYDLYLTDNNNFNYNNLNEIYSVYIDFPNIYKYGRVVDLCRCPAIVLLDKISKYSHCRNSLTNDTCHLTALVNIERKHCPSSL